MILQAWKPSNQDAPQLFRLLHQDTSDFLVNDGTASFGTYEILVTLISLSAMIWEYNTYVIILTLVYLSACFFHFFCISQITLAFIHAFNSQFTLQLMGFRSSLRDQTKVIVILEDPLTYQAPHPKPCLQHHQLALISMPTVVQE